MPRYARPPLRESVAEFRFAPGEPWDITVPGLLYERLRGGYPAKRQGRRVEVQTRIVDGQLVPVVRDQNPEIQFATHDGAGVVRVDVDRLAVGRAGGAVGWSRRRSEILEVLGAYFEIAGPRAFEQLRLHFVNRIDLAGRGASIDVSSFLTVWPRLPAPLGSSFGRFLVKVDLPAPPQRGHLVLTSGIAEDSSDAAGVGLILDLDFLSAGGPLPLDEAEAWLDGAHARILETFELCITDAARGLFAAA